MLAGIVTSPLDPTVADLAKLVELIQSNPIHKTLRDEMHAPAATVKQQQFMASQNGSLLGSKRARVS